MLAQGRGWWPPAFLISPRRYKIFILFFQQKMSPLFFISRSISRWASLACPLHSLFRLCLSISLYSKFVDMTINLSLILKKTGIQKHFPLSGFISFDSLAASALQEAAGYAIFRPNNLELHLGCHTCWLSYFTLVCLWCGWTVERTVTWLPNFLGWVDYHIFLPSVLRYKH